MIRGITHTDRRRGRNVRRAHGFTLLEILVVLVVLLIGIMAVLRLFPGGFLTIKRTGELAMAQQLSQQQLDGLKNQPSLPDDILPVFPNADGSINTAVDVWQDTTPNDLSDVTNAQLAQLGITVPNGFGPTGNDAVNPFFSDVNRFRYVMGETVAVPVPSSDTAKGYGSAYVLQFGPVYNQFGTDANSQPADKIQVYGTPLERVVVRDANQQGDINGAAPGAVPPLDLPTQYAIDYTDLAHPRIAFLPRKVDANRSGPASRTFLLSFDYYAAPNGSTLPKVKSVRNLALIVNDTNDQNPLPQWITLRNGNNAPLDAYADFQILKQESDVVTRKFRLMTGAQITQRPDWSDDPYEYAWFSPQEGDFANVGVLVLNPRAHSYQEQTSSGTQPLTVRVDYAILDNHILHEERVVSSASPYNIKLSLPFILTNGDILDNQDKYSGMFPAGQNDPAPPDVLILNASTGEEIGTFSGGKPDTDMGNSTLDAKTGVIRLDSTIVENATKNLQNATIRIYYKAQGDWGMQVQKAYSRYDRGSLPTDVSYKTYFIDPTSQITGSNPRRMYFRRCDAGKIVVLGEFFVKTNLAAPNDIKRFSNEAYRISDTAVDSLSGQSLAYIDLTDQHPEAAANKENWQWSDDRTGQAVSSVQGGSIRSRVIWKSAQNWRKVDTDTFLPQSK